MCTGVSFRAAALLVVLVLLACFRSGSLTVPPSSPSSSSADNGSSPSSSSNSSSATNDERIYYFNKCHGAGCPYTASWLVHTNLFKKTHWWLDSTKMEAASFIIFDKAHLKFQVGDPDAYYVHHMSMYEHLLHKKKGFDVAKVKTLTMSEIAFKGECELLKSSNSREYIGIVPFYGGLPPNVTTDLSVKSIGQGNSLVDAGTKALQCMATLCSVLKYFGHAVVGVARQQDQDLITRMIDKAGWDVKRRTHIIRFEMNKPAHLPFHLIGWTQSYVRDYNCLGYSMYPNTNSSKALGHRLLSGVRSLRHAMTGGGGSGGGGGGDHNHNGHTGHKKRLHSIWANHGTKPYASENIFDADSDAFGLCNVDFSKHHHGDPIIATYHRKAMLHQTDLELANNTDFDRSRDSTIEGRPINFYHPIRYVYYTECDQIVKFDSMATLHALTVASNDTTFFVGRRREKAVDSNETDYMGSLNSWRNCGAPGFSLHWPKDTVVRQG